jgi:hypothetical protein
MEMDSILWDQIKFVERLLDVVIHTWLQLCVDPCDCKFLYLDVKHVHCYRLAVAASVFAKFLVIVWLFAQSSVEIFG